MIEILDPLSVPCTWLVCEFDDRWLSFCRRYAPLLVPPTQPCQVQSVGPDVRQWPAMTGQISVAFWQIDHRNLVTVCEGLRLAAERSPHTLQLAATSNLTGESMAMLSELRISATVQRPEQFSRLKCVLRAHWSRQT